MKEKIHSLILKDLLIFAQTEGNLCYHTGLIEANLKYLLNGELSHQGAKDLALALLGSGLSDRLKSYRLMRLDQLLTDLVNDLVSRSEELTPPYAKAKSMSETIHDM